MQYRYHSVHVRYFLLVKNLDFVFIKDNARVHVTHIINKSLKSQTLFRMEWSSRSYILNLIQHVWDMPVRILHSLLDPLRNICQARLLFPYVQISKSSHTQDIISYGQHTHIYYFKWATMHIYNIMFRNLIWSSYLQSCLVFYNVSFFFKQYLCYFISGYSVTKCKD